MNIYGRFSAALGSVALNGVLALALAQGAGAATPTTNGSVHSPQSYTVYVGDDQHRAHERCSTGIQSRAILAVLLALIV
jgi:hypothetical protein